MGSLRVLGIDPGSHRTGWGIVDSRASTMRRIASGTIAAKGETLAARLVCIAEGLEEILATHRPDAVALERVFHAKNSDSALKLGHARGVAVLCAARTGSAIFEYSPSEIKQAATGRGAGTKEQVQQMVRMVLGCEGPLGLDESDALAIALCHIQHEGSAAAALLRDHKSTKRRRR